MFEDNMVDEHEIGTATARIGRILEIQELIIKQIRVMQTMTALDFLDFRDYLFPASGFQSYQFRKIEVLMGLRSSGRVSYHEQHFTRSLTPDQRDELIALEEKDSLLQLVEKWLERTPFLQFEHYEFKSAYEQAIHKMLDREKSAINLSDYLTENEKIKRLQMLGDTETYFRAVLSEEHHATLREKGEINMSYKATIAGLLIKLYRDEPILHLPNLFLSRLTEMDENLTLWRYRHAQMVLRMLGKKIGTGGSSGFDYLIKTAMTHQIFKDLYNLSTMLIPRSDLPELPDDLRRHLGYYYSAK